MVPVPKPRPGDSAELLRGREYLRLLRRTLIRVRALTSELIEPHGLTGPQMLALLWISETEGLTQIELAAELDSDPNTVSAMMRRMIAKGLIVRERSLTDGRAVQLSVTEQGRAMVDEALPDVDRLSRHLFDLMPPGGEAAVTSWLDAVIKTREVP